MEATRDMFLVRVCACVRLFVRKIYERERREKRRRTDGDSITAPRSLHRRLFSSVRWSSFTRRNANDFGEQLVHFVQLLV
jgi:hypothetical protein